MNRLASLILAAAAAALLCSSPCRAEDPDFQQYLRTVFDGTSGLPGGIANDIEQTKDGVLWIGTYGGLYRYSGGSIRWMGGLKEVKTVNCLYSDEAGRLWIGTNDNGVSIFIGQEITNTINKSSGLPSNSVRSIVQDSAGRYYVGTTSSLAIVTVKSGLRVEGLMPEVMYAKSLSAGPDGLVAAVNDEGRLFLIRDGRVIATRMDPGAGELYDCVSFSPDGLVYAGTQGSRIDVLRYAYGDLRRIRAYNCGSLKGINSISFREDGGFFICSDTGPGYSGKSGIPVRIESGSFDNSVENVLTDYQGNFWFTSSRKGIMRMTQSVFHKESGRYTKGRSVVNTVARWRGALFMGTDSGLDVGSESLADPLAHKLIEMFRGTRIRCLRQDSRGHLWICTSGKGVWDIAPDGGLRGYDDASGAGGSKFRTVLEAFGGVAAAGDSGIAFIRDGEVQYAVGKEQGLSNPRVLCLMERDGDLLAGTDGNGIAVVRGGRVVRHILQDDGLSSEIILRMVRDPQGGGAFIVTGNGLCYMEQDGTIRHLSKFPYYNNFDLACGKNGMLFVTSSAGLYITSRADLLAGKDLRYTLYNANNGMGLELVPNAWNDLAPDGSWWIAGKTGALLMNLSNYEIKVRSYRMLMETVMVDGAARHVVKGEPIHIGSDARRVELMPEVVNYSSKDPVVSTWLEGIDRAPAVKAQSELGPIAYTNLPPGSYTFHVAVLGSESGVPVSENTYRLVKDREFKDHWWFGAYVAAVAMLLSAYLSWLGARIWTQRVIREQKEKLDLQATQLRMVNETILTIAQAVDAKDERTSQHSRRVAKYAVMIAKRMGMPPEKCENLRQIALLHDIGKIGIPDRVLNKPGRLTDEEYEIMKTHVKRGAEILKNFTIIDNVAEGALYHHERYDGKGYAKGLKGEQIPLNARIIGIADAFDAMTSNRVYRGKLDMDTVIAELKRGRGTQFDPKIDDIMLSLIEDGTINLKRMYGHAAARAAAKASGAAKADGGAGQAGAREAAKEASGEARH